MRQRAAPGRGCSRVDGKIFVLAEDWRFSEAWCFFFFG